MTWTLLRARVARAGAVLRQVLGAPDYERYVAHVRERHPGTEPLGRAEFLAGRMHDRYSKPGAKCC